MDMMMKKIIAALCIMFVVVTTVSAAAAELYESCDLTLETLTTRAERHEIIIEKIIGVCLDDDVIERRDFVIDPGVEVGEEE